MHSRTAPVAFVVPSRAASAKLTPDGKRVCVEPLAMFSGLEGEAFHFLKDVATAGATGGCGDVIAQLAETKNKQQDDADAPFDLDARRSLSYTAFAAAYTGGFQHFLFASLSESIPDPMVRVVVNQGLIIPLCYYSLFMFLVPKLRATSQAEEDTLRESIDVVKMIPRNWLFWVPLQFIQFNFIPMEFQVIYCSFCGLVWNIILSLLTQGGKAKQEQPVPLPEPAMATKEVTISIPTATRTRPAAAGAGLMKALQSSNSPNYATKENAKVGSSSNSNSNNWLRILNNNTDVTNAEEETKADKAGAEEKKEQSFSR